MAFSPLRSKALHHGRSLSLPSSSPNPSTSQFDAILSRVKALEGGSSSFSSMTKRITSVKKLYHNIDNLLVLPSTHQNLSQCQEKWVDQVLDGHIKLLDACTTAKDLFSHTKHDVQELLSALRRKDVDGIQCYLTSRKQSKKKIQKSLKALKSFRSQCNALTLEHDMLQEAESVTLALLESLLSYMTRSKVQARQSGWSLVSRLVHSKKLSCQVEETDFTEFEKVDAVSQMRQVNDARDEELMNHLKDMDSGIQILEEELECLFRQIIKIRVSLLNILNL